MKNREITRIKSNIDFETVLAIIFKRLYCEFKIQPLQCFQHFNDFIVFYSYNVGTGQPIYTDMPCENSENRLSIHRNDFEYINDFPCSLVITIIFFEFPKNVVV